MIDALAADRSDQPLGEAILPRRARRNRLVTDAHGPQSACDHGTVDSVPIADQVARSLVPRERLADLTCNPFRGRVCRDVDPDKISAFQPDDDDDDDDDDIEQVEANGWDNEQIRGGDIRCMVAQKGEPPLRGWPISLDHVLGDAGLSDLKAELEQFAVDARRAPQRIVYAHPPNQRPQIGIDWRPASQGAGFPSPVPAETLAVPTH
jgi:hypothetical protein